MAKFDIFEDDALDLENLDLGFGLKNTVEVNNVGLQVEVSPSAHLSRPLMEHFSDLFSVHRNSRNNWVSPPATA